MAATSKFALIDLASVGFSRIYKASENAVPASEYGGKAAGLAFLSSAGYQIPETVVLAASMFNVMGIGGFEEELSTCHQALLEGLPWSKLSARLRELIFSNIDELIPTDIASVIGEEFDLKRPMGFAVRSSAADEDGTEDSFAGIYESKLGVEGDFLREAICEVIASAFSDRALTYRFERTGRIDWTRMAVIIQPMLDPSHSGVCFSRMPGDGGLDDVYIESVEGLGVGLVNGTRAPHSYSICRQTNKLIASTRPTLSVDHFKSVKPIHSQAAGRLSLGIDRRSAQNIARAALQIEEGKGRPVDIEWLIDNQGQLVLLQARPLTAMASADDGKIHRYQIRGEPKIIGHGNPITNKISFGILRRYDKKPSKPVGGDVVVLADVIDVDWYPVLKDCAAVVTAGGGFTSHIAIVLRERGIPSIIGVGDAAFEQLQQALDSEVTIDCSGPAGHIYKGRCLFDRAAIATENLPDPPIPTYLVSSSLKSAVYLRNLPLSGIGLVRMEFLVAQEIGIHPLAIQEFDCGGLDDVDLADEIAARTNGYASAREWYIQTLANSISRFANAASGKRVNVRLPDFIADDYLSLLGGERYQGELEANPMLGFRGTTKLISDVYSLAFSADCAAIVEAFKQRAFHNISVILPFCRTPEDAKIATRKMRMAGLAGIEFGMMVEIPSNILLAKDFAKYFDFFLVGPMDLTQLTYAADRKTTALGHYSSQTAATKEFVNILLERLEGFAMDIFIGGLPLCQYRAEYIEKCSNNRIHFVELPDRIFEFLESIADENNKYYQASTEGTCIGDQVARDKGFSLHAQL